MKPEDWPKIPDPDERVLKAISKSFLKETPLDEQFFRLIGWEHKKYKEAREYNPDRFSYRLCAEILHWINPTHTVAYYQLPDILKDYNEFFKWVVPEMLRRDREKGIMPTGETETFKVMEEFTMGIFSGEGALPSGVIAAIEVLKDEKLAN